MGLKQTTKILGAMERAKYAKKIDDMLTAAGKLSDFVKDMALQQTKCSMVEVEEKCAFFDDRALHMLIKRIAHPKSEYFLDIIDESMQKIRGSSLWDPYYEDGAVKALDKVYDINGLKKVAKRTKTIADVV